MDTIGNAFKTIYQRFSSIREGTSVDEFGEDISNVEKDLNAQGIQIRSSIGTFKSFDDVIQNLASHWSEYSDVVKSQITQDLAGNRQREILLTLLNNMNMALGMQATEAKSAGQALNIYNNVYAKSTEARISDLTNALQKMYMNLIHSDTINSVISAFTDFIKIIDRTVTGLGGIGTAVFTLTTAFVLFKSKAITGFITDLMAASAGETLFTTVTTGASLAIGNLGTALLGLLKNPMTWFLVAVGGVVTGIISLVNHEEKLKEQTEATKKAQTDFNTALDDFNKNLDPSKIDAVTQAFENLKQALGYKSDNDYDKDIESIQELQKKLDDLKAKQADLSKTDPYNDGYVAQIKKVTDQIDALKQKTGQYSDAQNKLNEAQEEANALNVDSVQNNLKSIVAKVQEIDADKKLVQQYDESVKKGKEDVDIKNQLMEKYPSFLKYIGGHTNELELNSDALSSNLDIQKNLALAEITEAQSAIQTSYDKTEQIVNDTEARMTALQAESDFYDAQSKKAQNAYQAAKASGDTEMASRYANAAAIYSSMGDNGQALLDANKKLQNAKNALSIYKGLLGKTPQEIYNAYTSGNSSGSGYIPESSGSSKSSIFTDTADEQLKSYNAQVNIDKAQEDHLNTLISIASKQKDYNKELDLTNQKLTLQKKIIDDLNKSNSKIHQAADKLRSSTKYDIDSWFDSNGQATQQYINLLNSFNGKTDEASKNQLSTIQKLFSDMQKLKQGWIDNKNAIDSMNDSLLDTENTIITLMVDTQKSIDQKALDNFKSIHQQKIDAYQSELDALKLKNEQLQDQNDLEQKSLDIEKAKQALLDAQNERNVRILRQKSDGSYYWNWEANQKAMVDAQETLLNAQKTYDDQIVKNQEDALQEKIDAENKLISDAQNSFDNHYKNIDNLVNDMLTNLGNYANNWNTAISQLQSQLSSFSIGGVSTGATGVISNNSSSNTSSVGSVNNATATIPGIGEIGVQIVDGHTVTTGLPIGTIVHTANGDYQITGGSGGNYTSVKIPSYDVGTDNHPGGLALVHQDEIINLPKGSQVLPKNLSQSLLSNVSNFMDRFLPSFNVPNIPLMSSNNSVGQTFHIGELHVDAPKDYDAMKLINNIKRLTNSNKN